MHGKVCIGDAVNWEHSLNRGLVSWWLALPGQQRGVMFRDLCMRNPCTLTNGPTWRGAGGRPGGVGALNFDGSDDYAQTTTVNGMGTSGWCANGMSVSCWVYWITATNNTTMVAKGPSQDFFLDYGGGAYPRFSIKAANTGAGPSATPTTGIWQFVCGTFDNATITSYLDGRSVATAASSGEITGTSTNVAIGARTGGTNPISGRIDDVRIWNRALSAGEIVAAYLDSRDGYPNTLNWSRPYPAFDQGVGGGGFNPSWVRTNYVYQPGAAA